MMRKLPSASALTIQCPVTVFCISMLFYQLCLCTCRHGDYGELGWILATASGDPLSRHATRVKNYMAGGVLAPVTLLVN